MEEAMRLSVCLSVCRSTGYRMYQSYFSSKGRHCGNKDSTRFTVVFCCQQAVLSQLVSTEKNVKQYTPSVECY